VKRLAAASDVLIENFKTGNLERYGLDYPALRAVNPRLVYCSITGFGQSGPYAELPGYDPIFQAMSGLMSVTGVPDGAPGAGPNLVGYSVSDITAGYYAVIAILAALNHRDRVSGEGQHIDLALLDAQLHAVSHVAMNYLVSGRMPVRAGAASQITCPWQTFDCADGPLMLAVGTDQQFTRLCEAMDLPDAAADPRFATNRARMEHRDALVPLLAARLRTRPARAWMEAFTAVGVASGPINDFGAVFADPQVRHREMLREMPHAKAGRMAFVANPVRLSATPVEYGRAPPLHGEHTAELLRDLLQMTDEEIAALRRDGAIA
jgi:crotonobetainyl-CoA:carnitine CoA-transferase CaiB-like acyl-CoA transferase